MTASPYDAFARAYDRLFARAFAPSLDAFDALGLRELRRGARVLDLCCGTGRVVAALRARGLDAMGLDASDAMLARARQNAEGATLVRGDARAFEVARRCDAVTCVFNALNELASHEDLAAALACVRRALVPGGRFFFEVALEDAFRARWSGSFARAEEDAVCAVFPSYDAAARLGRTRIVAFAKRGEWARVDVEIVQRAWRAEELREALSRAGLDAADLADAEQRFGRANERGRTFGVARAR